ncbi:MAG: hypothetical protein PHH60_00625 [Candidatus Margulisbacteria bacterium]|nr:hypothetical protein [Candidatus Margulisiibacteriota bacterium]
MNKFTVLVMALLGLALVLTFTGCNTATSTDTTTTTAAGGTTSTTAPGTATISGTITLSGQAGHLWVGATTDNTFMSGVYPGENNYTVAAGVTTYNYSLPISTAGTYYVIAVLAVGQATFPGPTPIAGDRVGEYSDGGVPAGFSQTPTGTPAPVTVTTGAVTGKNFELKVTWQ